MPVAGHTLTAGRPVTLARAGTDRKIVPKANQDVFLDLLVRLRELREERKVAAKPPAAKPPAAGRDYLAGPAPVEVAPLALVSCGMTQVVKVGNRDMGELLKTRIPMDTVHPFT